MKFLHTADWQIGMKAAHVGVIGQRVRDERQLVVLDDVLTATDAGRLARIMTILEEVAQHLQVLVITCHPERYCGLDDAQFFDLETILHDGTQV